MIKFKTINNEIVKPMKTPDDLDTRPPRGQALLNAAYANTYLCSKKRSGKTSVIAKMAMQFAGPKTCVHIFCSTVFIDPTYIELGKYFDKKGIPFYPSTSIKEDGHDLLDDIIEEDKQFINDEDEESDEDVKNINVKILDLEPRNRKKKKKRSKYKELRRLFIFDDLSNEMRTSASFKSLLKKNRHMLCKTLISSQWISDLAPQSIAQLDYVFLFKAHNNDKLLDLHLKLDLSISFELFKTLYKLCTGDKKRFDFLYITRFEEFRRNFNQLLIIEEE